MTASVLNTIVATYPSHAGAEAAVKVLQECGVDLKEVSIVGNPAEFTAVPKHTSGQARRVVSADTSAQKAREFHQYATHAKGVAREVFGLNQHPASRGREQTAYVLAPAACSGSSTG